MVRGDLRASCIALRREKGQSSPCTQQQNSPVQHSAPRTLATSSLIVPQRRLKTIYLRERETHCKHTPSRVKVSQHSSTQRPRSAAIQFTVRVSPDPPSIPRCPPTLHPSLNNSCLNWPLRTLTRFLRNRVTLFWISLEHSAVCSHHG